MLNVAAGKAPMQSSVADGGIPQKAIDGSTSTFFDSDTCSLTEVRLKIIGFMESIHWFLESYRYHNFSNLRWSALRGGMSTFSSRTWSSLWGSTLGSHVVVSAVLGTFIGCLKLPKEAVFMQPAYNLLASAVYRCIFYVYSFIELLLNQTNFLLWIILT